jgi:molybdenum cofactor cytidylyltransferase
MVQQIVEKTVGVVLLASGSATRMGQNKLLLPLGESQTPCIRRVGEMLAEWTTQVVVIYQDEAVPTVLADLNFQMFYNAQADKGQSEAIKLGVSQFWDESVQGWLFVMGDQPLLSRAVCERLVTAFLAQEVDVVVPCVGAQSYAPVIFHRDLKESLLKLEGDCGAKGIVNQSGVRVLNIDFQEIDPFMDMDTPETYRVIQDKLIQLEMGGAEVEKEI